ncbi:MAG: hypothetical protein ACKOBA_04020, partial [Limnohabitans sp.]
MTAGKPVAPMQETDAQETREWMDALSAVIEKEGDERAHYLLEQLLEHARENSIDMPFSATTGYVNTLEPAQEARCPGNIEIEERLRAYMRDRFNIPIPDSELPRIPFYKPADDTPEMRYLHERRKALGG